MLAARERQRQLRVAAPGGKWQREAAAEPRVDVGDELIAVRLTEALDVRRADELQLLGDLARERDQQLVADRHALDRLAALRLDHRARDRIQTAALQVAKRVDRELLPA